MRTFFWIASICTILGVSATNLLQWWNTSPPFTQFLLISVLIAAIYIAVVDLREWWRNRPKRYKTAEKVNEYMYRLLRRGGSLAIFAHNLSWIRDSDKVRQLLFEYGRTKKDVRIYVPAHNDLTRELSSGGVRVYTYERLDHTPQSRFTILNPNEPGSSLIAIARGTHPDFYIEEFKDSEHSRVIAVARDLLGVIERLNQDDKPE